MARTMTQSDAVEAEVSLDGIETFKARNAELVSENIRLEKEVLSLRAEKDQLQKRIPVKGFLLLPNDPFAEGTMRSYVKSVKSAKREVGQIEALPFVLPYSDPLARKSLEVYAVRAAGGGDMVRATSAKDSLELFPK
jgi:hypothetical protein